MRNYYISMFTEEGWATVAKVAGCEAAYNAFRKALEFCEVAGTGCCLVDGETGEVIADNLEEEGL